MYVVIIVVILVILLVLTFGSLVYLCRKGVLPCKKCCPKKRRRLHRYSPLADPEIMRMTHKSKFLVLADDICLKTKFWFWFYSFLDTVVSNSLLPSDLDSDTDSDVIFESKGNGHANGRLMNGRSEEIDAWKIKKKRLLVGLQAICALICDIDVFSWNIRKILSWEFPV